MSLHVYIPSRMRPLRQPAAAACTAAGIPFTIVLSKCDESIKDYQSVFGKETIATTAAQGICETRNACLDLARKRKHSKIVMIDDDVRFYARQASGAFLKATDRDIKRVFKWLDGALTKHAHAGLTDKFMSQSRPRGTREFGRYNQVLGYNLALWTEKFRFRFPVNEEHDMHLQLAVAGCPPLISYEFSKDAPYYARGGCSTWRTPEVELEGMRDMERVWPDYVKLVPNEKQISKFAIRVRWRAAVEDNRV